MSNSLPIILIVSGVGFALYSFLKQESAAKAGFLPTRDVPGPGATKSTKISLVSPGIDGVNYSITGQVISKTAVNTGESLGKVGGSVLSAGIVSPTTAIRLIKEKRYDQFRKSKMSRWYYWGDVFVGTQYAPVSEWGRASLQNLQNCVSIASIVDRVCDNIGRKAQPNSWYRLISTGNSRSAHLRGLAMDFDNTSRTSSLYKAVRNEAGIVSVGPSNRRTPPTLHIDISPNNYKKGFQWMYWDNGAVSQSDNIGFRPLGVGKDGI